MSAEPSVRAFFAVELGEAAVRAAAGVAEALRRADPERSVRWVAAENYHLTLRFLGETARSALAELRARVEAELGGAAPFSLRLGRARVFPSPRRPRVVALEIEPEAPLAELAARVERGVVAAQLPPEPRRFRPHLTLGRVRQGRPPAVETALPPDPSPFRVAEVVLFESRLHRDGARYDPLERIALGGSPHSPDNPPFEGEVDGTERAN